MCIRDRSNGNYSTIPSSLQKISTSDNKVTVLGTDIASNLEAGKDKIYLMKEDYTTMSTLLSYYDIATNKIVNEAFVEADKADIKLSLIHIYTLNELSATLCNSVLKTATTLLSSSVGDT